MRIVGKILRIVGKILKIILIVICVLLGGEWIISESLFQIWLRQDERRVDFSAYDTAETLRAALLEKLPVGSSKEEVQAFRATYGYGYKNYQKPGGSSDGSFGLVMQRSQQGRGLFYARPFLFGGLWLILFDLDETDHRLVDIRVILSPGP